MDLETRNLIKEARDADVRTKLGKSMGFEFSRKARKQALKDKHKGVCIRGCGRTAWQPPYGSGRCTQCANDETAKKRFG